MSTPPSPPAVLLPAVPPAPRYAPRRADCPWCGSRRLRPGPRLYAPPDRPVLVTCRDCRHAFHNPPPGPDGQDGTPVRAVTGPRHLSAARALLRHCPEPESWLDLDTGDARFPRAARRYFPYTSFDGVDPTHRVLRARAADLVEEAYVGRLTDPHLAARLRARYDVVSVLHLERSPDPRAELRAALRALRPGGHLLVDAAGPRGPLAAPPGTRTTARLRAELREHGCVLLTPAGRRRVVARTPVRPRALARPPVPSRPRTPPQPRSTSA
ncbi:methyltransferase domain-containing protein [Streptomyces sp. NPDC090994]|uniref:methyltransferase domain-containing protein n=1 Tax=Streptomyces sp. NPDC090994 TaxID=3365969 RepID=UPI003820D78A